jgi:hypothetical protein
MRYRSKDALAADIRMEHDALSAALREIPARRWREPGVWGEGWTVSDLVAHLAEWQRMFLTWYADGLRGATPAMPAPGYKWSETGKLNRAIREKNRLRSSHSVRADFESGYRRIVQVVDSLPAERLLRAGQFRWTGRNPLTTYLGANTASHYRFAARVIKRWLRIAAAPRVTETRSALANRRRGPRG